MKKFLGNLLSADVWLIFIVYCLILWLLGFVGDEMLPTDHLYEEYITSQQLAKYGDYEELSKEFEDDIEDFETNWDALKDYFIDAGLLIGFNLVRFTLVAAFIFIALSFAEIENLSFWLIFKVAIVAKMVFLVPTILKLMWFSLLEPDFDYLYFKHFNPFSISFMFDPLHTKEWALKLFSLVDIFEGVYVIILVIGSSIILSLPISKVIKPVLYAYLIMTALSTTLWLYIISVF